MGPVARENVSDVIRRVVDEYTVSDFIEDWDLDGLFTALADIFPVDFGPDQLDRVNEREELVELLVDDAQRLYSAREEELGEELMRALERYLLLQIIDNKWREHLYDMDYLREGIHLRGFAQIDPLVAYKNEAYELFTDLMNSIWADFARMIYHVEVEVEGTDGAGDPAGRCAGGPRAGPVHRRRRHPAAQRAAGRGRGRRLRRCRRGGRARRQRRGRPGGRHPDRPAAPRRRARHDRAQRPVLVRLAARSTRSATAPSAAMATSTDTPIPQRIAAIQASFALLRQGTDPDALAASIASLEQQMQVEGFWDDSAAAAKVNTEYARATRKLKAFQELVGRHRGSRRARRARRGRRRAGRRARGAARLAGAPPRRAGGGAALLRPLRRGRRAGHRQRGRRRHRRPGLGRDGPAHDDALGRVARLQGRAAGGQRGGGGGHQVRDLPRGRRERLRAVQRRAGRPPPRADLARSTPSRAARRPSRASRSRRSSRTPATSRSTPTTCRSTPTAPPAPAASTSTRPTRPCASPTVPPASSCSARTSARSRPTRTRR